MQPKLLSREPEGMESLGRPRRRCNGNKKLGLKEAGCDYMKWVELARDTVYWQALVNTVMNLRLP
jgi:hypothetical protein